ncbi:MAG: ROK family transcriptional regulator [Oscillospiraceae bacterium]|nr:ROK family transcriptional regulator [Oscillospiraceae bacterium]
MAKNTRNAEYTRKYNRNLFLRLLRIESMSQAEIARKMGLTRAGVSLITDELLHEGFVTQSEASASGRGRPPVSLALVPDAVYAVGIYLNRDGCYAGLIDICGNVHTKERVQLEATSDKLSAMEATIRRLLKASGISSEKLAGVGISAPGPLDGENGVILNPPRFDLWHNMSICAELKTRLDMPVYLENNASSLAQFHYGKPELCGSENFLLLLVDSGVGSGIISGGKLLKGVGYFTSELGHTSINYNGKHCVCGNIGCLEAYASIPSLLTDTPFKQWKELIDKRAENSTAFELINLELNYLAAGIMNAANIISIDTVVLAGDISYGTDFTAPLLEEKLRTRSMRRDLLPLKVIPAISEDNMSILSAADIAFNRFLQV